MSNPAAGGLVFVATYQWVTKDTVTPSAQVEEALDDALNYVQDEIDRTLPLGSYTETLRVYRNGTVFPKAAPIVSVQNPAIGQVSVQGAGIYIGLVDPTPVVNWTDWSGAVPAQATVTYTGGYTVDGVAGPILPIKLRNALCRVAFNLLHPAQLPEVPVGANSVHVGDVGYSGKTLRTFDPIDDGIRRDLKRYRRTQFLGWQT